VEEESLFEEKSLFKADAVNEDDSDGRGIQRLSETSVRGICLGTLINKSTPTPICIGLGMYACASTQH
jgi:hypothetical protein